MSKHLKLLGRYLLAAIVLTGAGCSGKHSQEHFTPQQLTRDFDYLWSQLRDNYAYFDQKETDWSKVQEVYRTQVAEAKDQREFITLLEAVLDELYDPHTHLKVNTSHSTRLVPTGLDVWAEWRSGQAIITQLREGFSAQQAGLKVGMEITSINDVPVEKAVNDRLGVSLKSVNDAARSWALRALLAGAHDTPRIIEARSKDGVQTIFRLDLPEHRTVDHYQVEQNVQWQQQPDGTGYISINDLGSDTTVAEFDAALERLKGTLGLVIDLRAIPSGGSTSVAEPIMGRLIERPTAYQKGTPAHGARWTRSVSPRGPWSYKAPIVVLVGRWTGSMGEGVAIGLDGMGRATVVGTRMAGLNGAVFDLELPNTEIRLNYAAEKLFHVNGTPREDFVPPVFVNLTDEGVGDPILEAGLRTLKERVAAATNDPAATHPEGSR